MNQYSQADIALKNLIENIRKSNTMLPSTEELVKEIGNFFDRYGVPANDVQVEVEDENTISIPQDRYDELLRSESEIDILCTLARDECIESRTLLAALDSIAHMREQRLDSCEVDADDE